LTLLTTGQSRVEWDRVLQPGEVEHVSIAFDRMIITKQSVVITCEMAKQCEAPELDKHGKTQWMNAHILCHLHPNLDKNGKVGTVLSCITDIR
jgi:hypothetical protein